MPTLAATDVAPVAPRPLFRAEALQAQQAQWMGPVLVGRPMSFSVITFAALAMAGALVAFASWGQVTHKVTVRGVLLPAGGLLDVTAPQTGVITEVVVREGEDVVAGQPLARLRSGRTTAAGDADVVTSQAMASRRESLRTEHRLIGQTLEQRLDSLRQRQHSLQTEERQAQADIDTHRLRAQLAQKSLERQQDLARSGFVAAAQVQQKQEELLDIQLRQRNAERNLEALQRDLQAAQAERKALDLQTRTTLAQLDRSLASLDQETSEVESRSQLVLVAPQSGRVSALAWRVGQTVQAGQAVASLLPAAASADGGRHPTQDGSPGDPAELQAQLFVPSRTTGFLKQGQVVWLRYAAFPYQKFGMAEGRVLGISRSPIAAQDLPGSQGYALAEGAGTGEPLYRITVRLARQYVNTYGAPTALMAGTRLEADLSQDVRKVWEWLLEPLLSVTAARG